MSDDIHVRRRRKNTMEAPGFGCERSSLDETRRTLMSRLKQLKVPLRPRNRSESHSLSRSSSHWYRKVPLFGLRWHWRRQLRMCGGGLGFVLLHAWNQRCDIIHVQVHNMRLTALPLVLIYVDVLHILHDIRNNSKAVTGAHVQIRHDISCFHPYL